MYSKAHTIWCQIMHQKYLNNSEPSRIFSILDPLKGSIFLDFMVDNISFWRDSWNGQPPLTILPDVHNIISVIEAMWGN